MKLREQYNTAKSAELIYASLYRYVAIIVQDWLNAKEALRTTKQTILENRYNQFNNKPRFIKQ